MREDERTEGARAEVANATDKVVEEAKRATATAKAEAADLVGTAREQGMRQMEAGRERVAERLESFADSIEGASRDLRPNEAWLADLLDRGAKELNGLAGTLQNRDVSSLIDGLQSFARRQPALFAGASVALGFAAVRLAKSAPDRRPAFTPAHGAGPHAAGSSAGGSSAGGFAPMGDRP